MGADVYLEFVLRDQHHQKLDQIMVELGYELDDSAIVCADLNDFDCEFLEITQYEPKTKKNSWNPQYPLRHLMELGTCFSIGPYINQNGGVFTVFWRADEAELSMELDRSEVIYKGSGWRTLDIAKAAPIIDPIIKSFRFADAVRIVASNL